MTLDSNEAIMFASWPLTCFKGFWLIYRKSFLKNKNFALVYDSALKIGILRTDEWVVCKVHTWDWPTLDFACFILKWSILKRIWYSYFIKSSRLQSTQNGHSVWVFFLKKKNDKMTIVRSFRRNLFGMNPDYRHSKSSFLQVT